MAKTLKIENKGSKGGALRLTLLIDGVPQDYDQGRFGGRRAVETAARRFGMEPMALQELIDKGEGEYQLAEARNLVSPPTPLPVFCRGLNETQDKAKGYETLEACLADVSIQSAEPVISWGDVQRLCAVDFDMHSLPVNARPSGQVLEGRILSVRPTPRYAWITHGRGIRLIYEKKGIYDASELAAAGAARLIQLEPLGTVELKAGSRHPLYPRGELHCGEVQRFIQTTDVSAISGWHEGRAVIDESVIEGWLKEHNYEIGKRYTHDRCPIDPGTESHGEPVCCNREGIFCHGCNGHGVRRGAKAPGWFPYSFLVGAPAPSTIAHLVENLVHWEHARFILAAHHNLSESVLRGAYGALLKSAHGDDPRIPAVFRAGADVVRFANRWGTLKGETWQTSRYAADIIRNLPTAQYIDESDDGCVPRVDGERVARLLQPVDLSRLGYVHLNPVWGLPIYSQFNEPRYPYELTMRKCPGLAPQYVPHDQRDMGRAWGRIQEAFPGVNRNAVRLLLAAKGFAEGDTSFPPMLFISGPTASAKSTTIIVAATIAGDRVCSIPMIGDDTRLRAAIFEAKSTGTFAVFNEAMKTGRGPKIGKAESMEFVLGLTPDSVSHRLYVGPTELGTLPVLVWTDVGLPQEVKQHGQLARRLIHVHLLNEVDWHASMKDTRMGKAEWLRSSGKEYADACDAILSEVIDDFFHPCCSTFEEAAKALGFATLKESDDAKSMDAELVTFYELCRSKVGEDGWTEIGLNEGSGIAAAWRQLADPPDYRNSMRCSEVDWMRLLGIQSPVIFRVNGRGSKVRVKFDGADRTSRSSAEEQGSPAGDAFLLAASDLPSF